MKTRPAPKTKRKSSVLRESAPVYGLNSGTVNLRFAKTHLSALIDRVEAGSEIVLTRDGKPAARLVAVRPERKPFVPNWKHLRSMPMTPDSTPLIREDRDGGVG
jgi:prevent-host-death family protein